MEVPDFERTARSAVRPFARSRRRRVGIRHLFGSHEASWAVHCEGWTAPDLEAAFRVAGVEPERTARTRWKDTYNLTVIGKRTWEAATLETATARARELLADYLVDETPGEMRLLEVWLQAFRAQLARTWASEPGA